MTSPVRSSRWLAAALALALAAAGARADDALPAPPRYDLTLDLAVTGAAGAATLALLGLEGPLAPRACRWCSPPGFEASAARSLAWGNPGAAATSSDVLVGVMTAGVLGYALLDGYRRDDPKTGWVNVLLVTEAVSLAMLLDTGVKYAVGRERPYAWLGRSPSAAIDRERNLSFFSGHATYAFSLAAASGTLFLSQRVPGAPWILAASAGGAAAVAYLRLAARDHYLTDVATGAVVGTVIGWAVPHFFHPAEGARSSLRLAPAPGGIAVLW
ncbi:phosphatase PAP2 family protein [Anaeromyxobacter paludicola]|uniref:Phosphatidic acid phosphatase type 2/haloperoxidase domain-containing protein n=1 Tax=Anaeromyxobacter paludicola TaxID=2918171 RepID=A0ABN6NB27_9BACT|nr:phosphatase PAP2 family protein [Anaeromyxobacter paludicola]BDG09631.1 hypothetical protein AMPC_27440 [Anaeromyxobacter paludicola]